MKPVNYNESGCDPISSNCVIWQGNDIDCINLCKGDTVSDVVFKLATELCDLMETFSLSNYDLSCLNLNQCAPEDFSSLINLLIERVCELEGVEPSSNSSSGDCPDKCIVPVCEDFYYKDPTGDTVRTRTLTDYVLAIGNRVCNIIDQIDTINSSLVDHGNRINALERTPKSTPAPLQITPTCVLPPVATDIDEVLAALEIEFYNLKNYTGNTSKISAALQAACSGLNNADKLHGMGKMSDIDGWINVPTSMADSFNNLWKTVCDMRNAVQYMLINCCDDDCSDIGIAFEAELIDPSTLRIYFTGSLPANYTDNPIGSTISISEVSGAGPQVINGVLINTNYLLTGNHLDITLIGINGANDLAISLITRFINSVKGSRCENLLQGIKLGTDTCPALVLVADYTGVSYSFAWSGTTPILITVELWNDPETTLLQSNTIYVTNSSPNSSFSGLAEGVDYKIRLKIHGEYCDFNSFRTLEYPCVAPFLQAPVIDYTNPKGDTKGNTIVAWQLEYDFYHP